MTQRPDGSADILTRLRKVLDSGLTNSVTREPIEHAVWEIERLREENERLRAHDFDLWLAEFEKFIAGQAETARDA